jgi:PAS domain S-box-containing protein
MFVLKTENSVLTLPHRQPKETRRDSKVQFRAIAEAMPLPVLVTTAADYIILYVNKNYTKARDRSVFDLFPEELIGRKATDFCHNPADLQTLRETLAKNGYISHYELQIKRADGMLNWIDLSIQSLVSDGQNLCLFCFFDITERKQIEAENHVLAQLAGLRQDATQYHRDNGSQFRSRPTVAKVFSFIESNYRDSIGLREVAQALNYSPAYLTNLVHKETGRTVNQWITEYRMAEARLLLLKTNHSVNQIAADVGYQSTEHFIRQFHQLHSMTPKVWRNQHRKCEKH